MRPPPTCMELERQWAAELARMARRAAKRGDGESASEWLDWALLLVPDALSLERLRIDVFLRENHLDSAETMIARRLLARPSDARLLMLQARCLHQRGELRRAVEVLRRVRAIAPDRRDALELAAEVASRLGDHALAVDLRARLLARHPRDERAHLTLIRALIATGKPEHGHHAERLLLLLDDPPAELLARSYMMQGRWREAADWLEPHVDAQLNDGPSEEGDSVIALYADAVEACGECGRINALTASVRTMHSLALPRTRLVLARILLAQGRFRSAAAAALFARRTSAGAHQWKAAPVAVVAAMLCGRKRLARRLASRFAASPAEPNVHAWVDCWRRGLRGRILHDQRCTRGRCRGGDPSPSVLRALLHNAAGVLEMRLRSRNEAGGERDAQVEHDLAVCHAALGAA